MLVISVNTIQKQHVVKYSRYTEDDILYTGLPFFHGNAQGITIGPAILADAKAVIVDRFSASRLWDDCRRWNCTEANYIGGIIPILLKQDEREDDGDNPVRLMVGAAAPKDEWHAFQQRFNTKILEVYGMTECYCCLVSPYDAPSAGACGKAITGWDVRIVDADDKECKPGALGEFVARPNRKFIGTTGYYNKPEATLELFRNGWIHTGDLGRMDEDGYFFFVDRKKQALRRRGENISSFVVESVINSHEAVLESCVVGVPSELGEEEVKAVVVLKDGHSVSEEELIRWCEPRLAYFAIPRYIAIRRSMPRTPSERVEKFKLKAEGITVDCWDREESGIELQRNYRSSGKMVECKNNPGRDGGRTESIRINPYFDKFVIRASIRIPQPDRSACIWYQTVFLRPHEFPLRPHVR
jgi:crotonobetaine/carnitine-CoA ligase